MKPAHRKSIKLARLLTILIAFLLSCSTQEEAPAPTLEPEVLAEYDAIKLAFTQEGLYRFPLADLGWDESIIDSIALTYKERPVPYWVESDEAGQSIIFYGEPSTSPYTPQNTYLIQQDPALVQIMHSGRISQLGASSVDYIISTVHAEENHIYTPKVKSGSLWHWSKIVAPGSQTLEIDLPRATGGPGNLRVALWGVTTAPASPAHHVRASINGQIIGEGAWDGQTWHTLEGSIPAGLLVEGKNTLEIQATGEIEARLDIVNLDWIEIDYQKSTDQLESQAIFRVPEGPVLLNSSYEQLTIFDITDPKSISRFDLPDERTGSLTFQGEPDHRYIAVNQDSYLSLEQIRPVTLIPDLRAESGADYLAIGHPELLEPLKPLLAMHSERGLKAISIPIEAIYDQFNSSLAEPEAIRQFLRFAVENWAIPPKYVLLVGDTSYDFYGYQTPVEDNFLPTFLVNTVFGGETGSDVVMAQINDDDWPDLAIGRVPARTIQQIETFVAKTLEYEQNSPSADWNTSILAVADGQEPSFQADAEYFIEQIPETYQTQLIAPKAGAQGTNQQIAQLIESGQLLTAYFGHGSINMWGKDSLFTTQDIDDLSNFDRLPVVLNFTCLTGLFTHPTEVSMAESLLFNPSGGAVAVLAPTSPTLPTDQTFLSNAFIEAMLQESVPRLGDITLSAWRKVPIFSESAIDVMQTFLLFGDPALHMPIP